jgi:hypothetical protein
MQFIGNPFDADHPCIKLPEEGNVLEIWMGTSTQIGCVEVNEYDCKSLFRWASYLSDNPPPRSPKPK